MSKSTERQVSYKSGFHKRFIQMFMSLAERHGRFKVWSDFITMSACSISNACDKRYFTEREKEYMKCVEKYTKDELDLFPEMFAQVVLAFEKNTEQDFLGDIFLALNLHDEWRGQCFTPYHAAEIMVKINFQAMTDRFAEDEPVKICDPTCGSGGLFIACINEAMKMKINYQEKMIIYAQDIDFIAAMMCYIQLSILGCKAIIKVGNALTDPFRDGEPLDEKIWLTPMLTCGRLFRIMSHMTEIGEEENNGGEKKVFEDPDEASPNLEGEISA